jgi:hypothetical protein
MSYRSLYYYSSCKSSERSGVASASEEEKQYLEKKTLHGRVGQPAARRGGLLAGGIFATFLDLWLI